MKWTTPVIPKIGDLRVIKKFAFLPEDLTEVNTTVWLESYYEVQRMTTHFEWRKQFTAQDWSQLPGGWILQGGEFKRKKY